MFLLIYPTRLRPSPPLPSPRFDHLHSDFSANSYHCTSKILLPLPLLVLLHRIQTLLLLIPITHKLLLQICYNNLLYRLASTRLPPLSTIWHACKRQLLPVKMTYYTSSDVDMAENYTVPEVTMRDVDSDTSHQNDNGLNGNGSDTSIVDDGLSDTPNACGIRGPVNIASFRVLSSS